MTHRGSRSSIRLFNIVLASLLVLIGAGSATATEYYVDGASGNDVGGCGTASGESSCATIQYLIDSRDLNGGDTVHIAAGVYRERLEPESDDKGSSDNPLTFTSDGADVKVWGLTAAPLDDGSFVQCTSGADCGGTYLNTYRIDVSGRTVKAVTELQWQKFLVDDSDVTGVEFEFTRPVLYSKVSSVAQVEDTEGSWYLSGSTLYVRTFHSEQPTTGSVDVEILDKSEVLYLYDRDYLRFEGIDFAYGASAVVSIRNSTGVEIRDSVVHTTGGQALWCWSGCDAVKVVSAEASHAYGRGNLDDVNGNGMVDRGEGWVDHCGGTAFKIDGGSNHRVSNVTAYNGWNVMSVEAVNNSVFTDVLVKNSPNHTFIMFGENSGAPDNGDCYGNTITRSIAFNGQDQFFIRGCVNGVATRNLGTWNFFNGTSYDGDSYGWFHHSNLTRGVIVQSQSQSGWDADYNHYPLDNECDWGEQATSPYQFHCNTEWPSECNCDQNRSHGSVKLVGVTWPFSNGLATSRLWRDDFYPQEGSATIDAGGSDIDGDGADDACTEANHCDGQGFDIGPMELGIPVGSTPPDPDPDPGNVVAPTGLSRTDVRAAS